MINNKMLSRPPTGSCNCLNNKLISLQYSVSSECYFILALRADRLKLNYSSYGLGIKYLSSNKWEKGDYIFILYNHNL
jgi:hypothetical protein